MAAAWAAIWLLRSVEPCCVFVVLLLLLPANAGVPPPSGGVDSTVAGGATGVLSGASASPWLTPRVMNPRGEAEASGHDEETSPETGEGGLCLESLPATKPELPDTTNKGSSDLNKGNLEKDEKEPRGGNKGTQGVGRDRRSLIIF